MFPDVCPLERSAAILHVFLQRCVRASLEIPALTPLCDPLIQSQGGHHHHPSEEALGGPWEEPPSHAEDLDAVWKGLTALAGVYVMFLIEHFLTLGKIYKDKKQKVLETFTRPCGLRGNATPSDRLCVCAPTCTDPEEVGPEGQVGSREAAGSGGERPEAQRR